MPYNGARRRKRKNKKNDSQTHSHDSEEDQFAHEDVIAQDGLVEQLNCWICLEDGALDEFISPCRCKGSMGKVHESCLLGWLQHNLMNSDGDRPTCPNCKERYVTQAMNFEQQIEEFRIEENSLFEKLRFVFPLICKLPPGDDRCELLQFYSRFVLVLLPFMCMTACIVFAVVRYWLQDKGPPATYGLFRQEQTSFALQMASNIRYYLTPISAADFISAAVPTSIIEKLKCMGGFVFDFDQGESSNTVDVAMTDLHPSGLSEGWFNVNVFLNLCRFDAVVYFLCTSVLGELVLDVAFGLEGFLSVTDFILLRQHLFLRFAASPSFVSAIRSMFVQLATCRMLMSLWPTGQRIIQFLVFYVFGTPTFACFEFLCYSALIRAMMAELNQTVNQHIELCKRSALLCRVRILSVADHPPRQWHRQ